MQEPSQDDDNAGFSLIQRYSSCTMCMCGIYIFKGIQKYVCGTCGTCVCKTLCLMCVWICVWHWVAPYLREQNIFPNELELWSLMTIEYSTFWRICSTSLTFWQTKPSWKWYEMIWFYQVKKVLLANNCTEKEKNRYSKYSVFLSREAIVVRWDYVWMSV